MVAMAEPVAPVAPVARAAPATRRAIRLKRAVRVALAATEVTVVSAATAESLPTVSTVTAVTAAKGALVVPADRAVTARTASHFRSVVATVETVVSLVFLDSVALADPPALAVSAVRVARWDPRERTALVDAAATAGMPLPTAAMVEMAVTAAVELVATGVKVVTAATPPRVRLSRQPAAPEAMEETAEPQQQVVLVQVETAAAAGTGMSEPLAKGAPHQALALLAETEQPVLRVETAAAAGTEAMQAQAAGTVTEATEATPAQEAQEAQAATSV